MDCSLLSLLDINKQCLFQGRIACLLICTFFSHLFQVLKTPQLLLTHESPLCLCLLTSMVPSIGSGTDVSAQKYGIESPFNCHWAQWDSFTTRELKESQECKPDLCFASLQLPIPHIGPILKISFLPKLPMDVESGILPSFFLSTQYKIPFSSL